MLKFVTNKTYLNEDLITINLSEIHKKKFLYSMKSAMQYFLVMNFS